VGIGKGVNAGWKYSDVAGSIGRIDKLVAVERNKVKSRELIGLYNCRVLLWRAFCE
jgi:hypothetical protein